MNIELPNSACTGCGACLQTCKVNAITMDVREDGFAYPHINTDRCVQCGQCMQSCHALGNGPQRKALACYAAQISQEKILQVSTSGGLFYALAQSILSQDGVVYGCAYDDQYNASIERADTLEKIIRMHGSKYVWSSSSDSYPCVKADLENGKTVLYTGLPCQIAGLKKYLRIDYPTLYTVDVLCGGAPSPYAFQRYLETLTDEAGKKNLQFQFRDKEKYGSGVNCTYFVNGVKHHENYLENSYYYAFSSKSRVTWRTSCYECNYKSISRASDMTIGDYWGVEKYHSAFRPQDGVSVVLINSDKGSSLFERIKGLLHFEESCASYATERNSLVNEISEGHVKKPDERDEFFRMLRVKGWKAVDRKFLRSRKVILRKQLLLKIYRKCRQIISGN